MLSHLTIGLLFAVLVGLGSSFTTYWNVPIEKCTKLGVTLDYGQYLIVHNSEGTFLGDKINTLYRTGLFPKLAPNGSVEVNEGLPQLGNLSAHEDQFVSDLMNNAPHAVEGPLVIDFEDYLPSLQVYHGSQHKMYLNQSKALELEKHPNWSDEEILEEAYVQFNASAKEFFQTVLNISQTLRPGTLVGHYHFPYCKNYDGDCTQCKPEIEQMNDVMIDWLYNESKAMYPSVYLRLDNSCIDFTENMITTRMKETQRVNQNLALPVLPYFSFKYQDTHDTYLTEEVLEESLWAMVNNGADGVIIWGSSSDLTNVEECQTFQSYFNDVLGPVLQCFNSMSSRFIERLKAILPLSVGNTAIKENWRKAGKMVHQYCQSKLK